MPRTISTVEADAILDVVCDVWHVGKEELLGRSRRQPVAFARQVAMAVTYQLTQMSLDDVGEFYGERDHGTVLWAMKVVDKASGDAAVKDLVSRVVKKTPSPIKNK